VLSVPSPSGRGQRAAESEPHRAKPQERTAGRGPPVSIPVRQRYIRDRCLASGGGPPGYSAWSPSHSDKQGPGLISRRFWVNGYGEKEAYAEGFHFPDCIHDETRYLGPDHDAERAGKARPGRSRLQISACISKQRSDIEFQSCRCTSNTLRITPSSSPTVPGKPVVSGTLSTAGQASPTAPHLRER